MTPKSLPTKEFLLWLFDYDRERGILIWKNVTHLNKRRLIGRVAGSLDAAGEGFDIRIQGVNYRTHRLIWFIETGEQPEMIDHIDGDILNNRIGNLRASNNRANQQNRHTHRAGRLVGTTWNKEQQMWIARIVKNKKKVYLGRFNTEREAHKAYLDAVSNVLD
jgi:hypothetical protein